MLARTTPKTGHIKKCDPLRDVNLDTFVVRGPNELKLVDLAIACYKSDTTRKIALMKLASDYWKDNPNSFWFVPQPARPKVAITPAPDESSSDEEIAANPAATTAPPTNPLPATVTSTAVPAVESAFRDKKFNVSPTELYNAAVAHRSAVNSRKPQRTFPNATDRDRIIREEKALVEAEKQIKAEHVARFKGITAEILIRNARAPATMTTYEAKWRLMLKEYGEISGKAYSLHLRNEKYACTGNKTMEQYLSAIKFRMVLDRCPMSTAEDQYLRLQLEGRKRMFPDLPELKGAVTEDRLFELLSYLDKLESEGYLTKKQRRFLEISSKMMYGAALRVFQLKELTKDSFSFPENGSGWIRVRRKGGLQGSIADKDNENKMLHPDFVEEIRSIVEELSADNKSIFLFHEMSAAMETLLKDAMLGAAQCWCWPDPKAFHGTHNFRHGACVDAFQEGGLKLVMLRSGHESIEIARQYAMTDLDRRRSREKAVSAALKAREENIYICRAELLANLNYKFRNDDEEVRAERVLVESAKISDAQLWEDGAEKLGVRKDVKESQRYFNIDQQLDGMLSAGTGRRQREDPEPNDAGPHGHNKPTYLPVVAPARHVVAMDKITIIHAKNRNLKTQMEVPALLRFGSGKVVDELVVRRAFENLGLEWKGTRNR